MPFEFYDIFNQNIKGILGFRSAKPVLGGYKPKMNLQGRFPIPRSK